jgi:hypothetical protein
VRLDATSPAYSPAAGRCCATPLGEEHRYFFGFFPASGGHRCCPLFPRGPRPDLVRVDTRLPRERRSCTRPASRS